MELMEEKDKKKTGWILLPLLLFLIILCNGTVSIAQKDNVTKQNSSGGAVKEAGIEIYVHGGSSTNGEGTELRPFNNMEDAIAKAEDGSIIWIMGTVYVNSGENKTWTADPVKSPDIVVKRHENLKNNMVYIKEGSLTLSDIVLDGNGENIIAGASMIYVEQGKLVMQEGAVLRNSRWTNNDVQQPSMGGAIHAASGSQVEINGGEVINNTIDGISGHGGAVCVNASRIEMSGGMLSGNSTAGYGGALYGFGNSVIEISGGEISNNEAMSYGGAIYITGSSGKITGGVISNNEASYGGGIGVEKNGNIEFSGGEIRNNRVPFNGGGFFINGSTAEITGGIIRNNNAYSWGGGLFLHSGYLGVKEGEILDNATGAYGGGIGASSGGELRVEGGRIAGNTAGAGGGIATDKAILEIEGGEMSGNSSVSAQGGGMYIISPDNGESKITGGEISYNLAEGPGGGVYAQGDIKVNGARISGNQSARTGGGFYLRTGTAEIKNTEFDSNIAAESGGGIWIAAYDLLNLDTVTFSNNTASEGYFWSVDPGAVSGNSYYHNLYVKNCTYSHGPVNEDKTIFAGFTNAYNNYDVVYIASSGSKPPSSDTLDITKTITEGGTSGLITAEEEMTYGISYAVKKNYDGILAEVYVEDVLPDGVELVSCTGSYQLYDEDGDPAGSLADAKKIKWSLGAVSSNLSGTFTVKVKVLKKAGGSIITNKAGIIAEQEYLEKWDEASIEVDIVEIIEFSVPKQFDYGEVEIGPGRRYFGLDWQTSADKDTGKNIIAVEDTRLNLAADWKLYANLSGEVRDQNGTGSNILNDVLVYCEEGTESTLTGANTLIADKSKYGAEYNWISEDWYQDYKGDGKPTDGKGDKGLYMVLQPGQGSITEGGSYKGEITWILAYTP